MNFILNCESSREDNGPGVDQGYDDAGKYDDVTDDYFYIKKYCFIFLYAFSCFTHVQKMC